MHNEKLFDGLVLTNDGEVRRIQLYYEEGWGTNAWVSDELRDDVDGTLADFQASIGKELYENLDKFVEGEFIPVSSVWQEWEEDEDDGA